MAPHTIGRYDMIAELGRGGMATVYHAHDPDIKRQVAIKVIRREFVHLDDFISRFQREAEISAALEHAAVVPIYDYGIQDDLPYLVMRFMAGGPLSERIAREPLSVHEVIHLFDAIAPAIDKAHRQGFVHRDLKPDNILFDSENNPFIADFGIVKVIDSTSDLTGTGSIIGTAAYMSPEQIQDRGEIDHRSDLYSLGVILYEALTGQMPFKVDSSVGYFSAHLNDPIPDILDDNPALPPLFSSIIYKALAKDKAARYQSAAEFAADVNHALDDDGYFDNYHTLTTHAPPTRRMPSYPLIGVGALILLGLAILLLSGVLGGNRQAVGGQPEALTVQDTASPTPTDLPAPTNTEAPTAVPTPTQNPLLADLVNYGPILYHVFPLTDDQPRDDLYVIDADGRHRKRLTLEAAIDADANWSPDGSQIVFTSDRDADEPDQNAKLQLYIMDSNGSNAERLTNAEQDIFAWAWSAGGDAILAGTRDHDVAWVDAVSGEVTNLTPDTESSSDYLPDLSPDGTQIVFSSSRFDNYELIIMANDGSNPRRITTTTISDDIWPKWSPDGLYIAYIAETFEPERLSTIMILDVQSLSPTAVTGKLATPTCGLDWSPDGRFIVYGSISGLWIVEVETGLSVRIATGVNCDPDWYPIMP